MSLIAITPDSVVFDYTFVTSHEELISHPKGRYYAEHEMWVLICGGFCNEAAYEFCRDLVLEYLKTDVIPEIKDAEMFMQPVLVTTPTRAFRIYLGKFTELLEPDHTDGILQTSWFMCRASKLTFEESCKVMAAVCPTMRRADCYNRITGKKEGEFHARYAL